MTEQRPRPDKAGDGAMGDANGPAEGQWALCSGCLPWGVFKRCRHLTSTGAIQVAAQESGDGGTAVAFLGLEALEAFPTLDEHVFAPPRFACEVPPRQRSERPVRLWKRHCTCS